MAIPKIDYTEEQINNLIKGIYDEYVNEYNLPKKLYNETARILKKAVYKGYGGKLASFDYGTPDYELLSELRDNVYMFSGAKTYTQVKEISSLMYEGNEKLSFSDFKKKALAKYDTYNKAYLETEYVTALTSGNEAIQWQSAQEDIKLFPQLKYTAILDQHTSEICKRLDGVVMPTNSPFWNIHTPPNHFNCRCHIEKIDKYDTEPNTNPSVVKSIIKFTDENMKGVFKMNPGKDRVVFKTKGEDKHPYFDVEPKDKGLAKKNFNLPIPEKD